MPTVAGQLPAIVLTTLNAKYIHASLGLRYLLANLGELRPCAALREYTVARPASEIVADLLVALPSPGLTPIIVGFGVYVWNVLATSEVVRGLKAIRPDVCVVLGGPEVSHELARQEIVALADYVVTGWGEVSFAKLCRALLAGATVSDKVIVGEQPPLADLVLPYDEYTAVDLAQRVLYVEASRGCPFRCEFCLSSLDRTAWAFATQRFLAALQRLYERGARRFKFVDRTFNLASDTATRILQFFLDRLESAGDPLFVHFEVIPDRLPAALRACLLRFPPGALQLEIGVQTFDPAVQQRIARRQDNALSMANLSWLRQCTHAHLHTDLIFGLPGETLQGFAGSFDRLYALRPHEIQLGLLKRLRGAPISRHDAAWDMVYDERPPYTVRQTSAVTAAEVVRVARMARYWELVANSGRFPATLRLLMEGGEQTPFAAFLAFSDALWAASGTTRGQTPEQLVDRLGEYLLGRAMDEAEVLAALLADYVASGARGCPRLLRGLLPRRSVPLAADRRLLRRQGQHGAARKGAASMPRTATGGAAGIGKDD